MASLAEIQAIVQRIKDDLPTMVQRSQISPAQIVAIGLAEISKNMGLIQAGEFRVGNSKEPGFGFTGGRYGYPGFSYGGTQYFLAGVSNDVLQVGLSITDGKLYAGGGTVVIDSTGITMSGGVIQSANYVADQSGFRIDGTTGNAEFNNIKARGMIRTAVFQKDTISSLGGRFLILDSDALATDMTALDSSTLTILGTNTFAVGDVLRMKDAVYDEWFQVTSIASAPTYVVTRDKASAYAANSNPTWKKGQAVVNYGPSGNGGIELVASADPFIRIFTHAGSPWTTTSRVIQFDENGITLANGTNSLNFRDSSDSSIAARVYAASDDIRVQTKKSNGRVYLRADHRSGGAQADFMVYEHLTNDFWTVAEVAQYSTYGVLFKVGPFETYFYAGQAAAGQTSVVNDFGHDIDMRFEGDTDPNLLVLDAGLDAVAIGGVAESGYKLKVHGKINLASGNTYDINGSPHSHDKDTISSRTRYIAFQGLNDGTNVIGSVDAHGSLSTDYHYHLADGVSSVIKNLIGVIIPADAVAGGAASLNFLWSSSAGGNNVNFSLVVREVGDNASSMTVLLNDTADHAAHASNNVIKKTTVSLTTSPTAGKSVSFAILRNGAAGGDTNTGTVSLWAVWIEYTADM